MKGIYLQRMKRILLITLLSLLSFKLTFAQRLFGNGSSSFEIISPHAEYQIGTAFCSVLNGTFTAVNIIRFCKPEKQTSKATAEFSLVTGLLEAGYGIFALPLNANSTDEKFASFNVGLGLATVVTSYIRLYRINKIEDKTTTFNIFCTPALGNTNASLNVRFVKQF